MARRGKRSSPISYFCFLVFVTSCVGLSARAQSSPSRLSDRIQNVIERPEFVHANFGVEFISLDSGKVIYALNSSKMFVPASTTKIFTEGTLLAKLGADYRFHTSIYRTGPIDSKGRLKGDLILVAGGDPNLSNRIQPDGTLAFRDDDHSYGGPAVAGDPLAVIQLLAKQVAAKGIRKIEGRVLIDASLLPDGAHEPGTDVVMSSIIVNDNLIDLLARPGTKPGDPAILETSPQTSYVKFVNHLTTTVAGTPPSFSDPEISTNPDGTVVAVLHRQHARGRTRGYGAVSRPVAVEIRRNCSTRVALRGAGIQIKPPEECGAAGFRATLAQLHAENLVAEHVSPPLSEEVKVTLKVSQNLHAAWPPIFSARSLAGIHATLFVRASKSSTISSKMPSSTSPAPRKEMAQEEMLPTISAPTSRAATCSIGRLAPITTSFFNAMPILGKDGTLAEIQTHSLAAGHVFAKTGTLRARDRLNGKPWLRGKALAGYVITKSGEKLAFAAYVNNVSLPPDPNSADRIAGQALGEIAAAAYDAPLESAYDLIIRNGHVIDGTGNPWYAADVAIKGDRIAAIGDLRHEHAAREIDASGRMVAPGFIDMLGQSEISLLLDNRSLSKLSQGITTEITGESATVAPQSEKTLWRP